MKARFVLLSMVIVLSLGLLGRFLNLSQYVSPEYPRQIKEFVTGLVPILLAIAGAFAWFSYAVELVFFAPHKIRVRRFPVSLDQSVPEVSR